MRSLAILLITMMLTSGCLSSVEDTISPERELFDDTIFIDEDGHMKLEWTIDSVVTIRITLEVLDGPNIDLYTMSKNNYNDYEECNEFNYYAQLSDEDTSNTNIEVNVEPGTYVTVIDNTDCGEASPPDQFPIDDNDRARVQYRITAQ